MRNFKIILCTFLLIVASFSCLNACEKIYISETELCFYENTLLLHLGENTWTEVSSIYTDESGIFTYEESCSTEKKWKCPYCNRWWPLGTPCQYADCPSKY